VSKEKRRHEAGVQFPSAAGQAQVEPTGAGGASISTSRGKSHMGIMPYRLAMVLYRIVPEL
jgi:hypothetical protein